MKNLEFKGTKGKWFACCAKKIPHFVFTENGEATICGLYQKQEMSNDLTDEEFRANANLIASAPELLESLFELVSLKKWKDEFGKDEWYLEKQPIAWENAEKVLEKTLT